MPRKFSIRKGKSTHLKGPTIMSFTLFQFVVPTTTYFGFDGDRGQAGESAFQRWLGLELRKCDCFNYARN